MTWLHDIRTWRQNRRVEFSLLPPEVQAAEIIRRYARGSVGTMIAIPIPGVDMAATYALWAQMIRELAEVYGYHAALPDAKALAADLFSGVTLTTIAWFASAKTATFVLKFIPGAGTVTAYLIDAAIAGFGAKKITSGVGFAAAAYYQSGKTLEPKSLGDEIARVLKDPKVIRTLLQLRRKIG